MEVWALEAYGASYTLQEILTVKSDDCFVCLHTTNHIIGFNIATPVFDGANEVDIMDTLDLANDYVNLSWEEFEARHKEELLPEVMDYLYENRDHRALWKGVPLSRDGKVRLRDGRTGEYFDSPVTIGHMHYLKRCPPNCALPPSGCCVTSE